MVSQLIELVTARLAARHRAAHWSQVLLTQRLGQVEYRRDAVRSSGLTKHGLHEGIANFHPSSSRAGLHNPTPIQRQNAVLALRYPEPTLLACQRRLKR
jgi:hypothetical protein